MRGKVKKSGKCFLQTRITPACAGKRKYADGYNTARQGSPPRVRGKVTLVYLLVNKSRITPACAGKRPRLPFFDIFGGDHPRVCGEKARCTAGIFPVSGSPSRVRGKVYSKGVGQIYSGITPACAGKRPACPAESALVEDHPRVCGEKLRLSLFFASSLGSPPRVRGKASLKISFFMVARITPACAGKSWVLDPYASFK